MRPLLLAAALTAGLLAGLAPLRTPEPAMIDAPPGRFAAARAMRHVEAIANAPHPMGSPAHAAARDYVVQVLDGLGIAHDIQRTTSVRSAVRVRARSAFRPTSSSPLASTTWWRACRARPVRRPWCWRPTTTASRPRPGPATTRRASASSWNCCGRCRPARRRSPSSPCSPMPIPPGAWARGLPAPTRGWREPTPCWPLPRWGRSGRRCSHRRPVRRRPSSPRWPTPTVRW